MDRDIKLPVEEQRREIGKKLRMARENKGLRQEDVGDLLGMAAQGYARYEKGAEIRTTLLIRLCTILECSPAWLLGIEEKGQPLPQGNPMQHDLRAALDLLNKEGQKKVVGYAEDLVASGKYATLAKRARDAESGYQEASRTA